MLCAAGRSYRRQETHLRALPKSSCPGMPNCMACASPCLLLSDAVMLTLRLTCTFTPLSRDHSANTCIMCFSQVSMKFPHEYFSESNPRTSWFLACLFDKWTMLTVSFLWTLLEILLLLIFQENNFEIFVIKMFIRCHHKNTNKHSSNLICSDLICHCAWSADQSADQGLAQRCGSPRSQCAVRHEW